MSHHRRDRVAKFAAQQAALPAAEQVANRDDWDDFSARSVSVLYRHSQSNVKDAFIEFMTDPLTGVGHTRTEAEAYFEPGGTPFTTAIVRKFLEVSAISRTGVLEDALSTRSILSLLTLLCAAAKYAGNPIDLNIRKDAQAWVEGSLVSRGLAHTRKNEKVTAMPQDVTSLLRKLFDRAFMSTLASTRDALLLALFICLQIDCGARVSEFLMPHMALNNRAQWKLQHKAKIFTWSNIELFVVRDAESDPIYLQARLKFRCLKDVRNKGENHKTIPLRLLPPKLSAEDSLFWLTILGLIDGVFEGFTSWSDFERVQPGPHGFLVPIKDTMKEVPVRTFVYVRLKITKLTCRQGFSIGQSSSNFARCTH